ncbi:hypothetical protein L7F22_016036 [Adiantum nelumboides]|nr:hypothetical protein [Adiantum nelumboides]
MSPEESISHRQKELLKLEEDKIQSAYLVEVGQKRRHALISRQAKFQIFQVGDWVMIYNSKLGPHPGKLKLRYFGPYQIVSEQGQGTFLLKDVFGTQILKPVNGFSLKNIYGKVPEVPKWMVNKAKDIVSKLIAVSVMWVAPKFLEVSLATCGGNLKPVEGSGIWSLECKMYGGILTAEVEVQREENSRNGIGQKDQGVLISGGTYFKAKTTLSAEVTHLRTNIFWVNLAWRAQIKVKILHYKYKVVRSVGVTSKVRVQDAPLESMPHMRSMKMAMEELLKLRQHEEHVEAESKEESVETTVVAFDPNQEETQVSSGLKTPVADVSKEEGTISGLKRRKLLLGSPTVDKRKLPFSVSWKDLEEPESKDQDAALRVLENEKLEHKCTSIPEWKIQKVKLQLLQVKLDKERLQEKVLRITEEDMARNAEILSVAKDFT